MVQPLRPPAQPFNCFDRQNGGETCSDAGGPDVSFSTEVSSLRAKTDVYGYLIAFAANLAILQRALPTMGWDLLCHYLLYLPALAALAAWSVLGRQSYSRWRDGVQAAVRLQSFLLPCHRRVWAHFIGQPPAWRAGLASELINAGIFAGGLLGQSYVGVLALVSFANQLPLWLHVPVQLVSVTLIIRHNSQLCSSALLSNQVAQGFTRALHGWLDTLCLVLPMPTWPQPHGSAALECRRVAAFLQLALGFLLPTLLLARNEHREFQDYQKRQRQKQRERERQRLGSSHRVAECSVHPFTDKLCAATAALMSAGLSRGSGLEAWVHAAAWGMGVAALWAVISTVNV